jgi:2-polyprenyl-6-methoxyphenol hydroxylase-like FAD-dependent oxidoreductase
MRVIIVGGGLAGLTLASALEKATIDFVLLEARGRFDPQVGASIGLNAAAMRILDQLGAAEEIVRNTAPVELSKVHRSDGTLVMPPAFTFQILKARYDMGGCLACLETGWLKKILGLATEYLFWTDNAL